MNQLDIFDTGTNIEKLRILDGNGKKVQAGTKHKIYNVELKNISYKDVEELFFGFNEIRAITFSYDIKFVNKIMKMFDYGEIILGGRFMTRRDSELHKLTAEAYLLAENMTLSEMAADAVRKEKDLVKMMGEGALSIRSPKYIIDHRKIYLLKADDGRTRVIKGSANMTSGAWSGNQLEAYEVDDTYEAYEAYMEDFETAWKLSDDIPEDVVGSVKTDIPEKDIPVIKEVVKTQKAIVLEKPEDGVEVYEKIKYTIDADKIMEKNKELVSNVKTKSKNGYIEIVPNLVKKISVKAKSLRRQVEIKEKNIRYPELTFDFNLGEAFLDDEKLDLNPKEEVKNDISLLFEAFDNYKKDFIGETDRVRDSHYKLLNILFSSPFHAKLRCVADIKNIPTSSLPLYTLLASKGSNSGKTFMTELILKLMTNKDLRAFSVKTITTGEIDDKLTQYKGVPIFVDEIDGPYYGRLKEKIKNSHHCELSQREEQPLFVFASNCVSDPEEPERKRMPFLRYSAGLKTDIDPLSYDGISKNMRAKVSNALYREYLRRMIKEVDELIDYMIKSSNIADDYYPDMMAISSRTLRSIFTDFGYEIPDYARELNWNDDFSYHAKYISKDALEGISKLWENEPKSFIIKSSIVIIISGSDKGSRKMLESWANSLPVELKAQYSENMEGSRITVNRQELEEALGFKFSNFAKFFRR
ncbi:lantibiotic ABC transporter [Finegoldia magna ALB8]|uniref:phospholipase D family protein n=1 Tax=Finegoldia magna TaxID=1260 RepID=UPI0004530689|nr:phospholipase D family protein [Finegoldia magna]EXF27210.1 lantibiotic ABC transporter [Finegoldia magna ALB8]